MIPTGWWYPWRHTCICGACLPCKLMLAASTAAFHNDEDITDPVIPDDIEEPWTDDSAWHEEVSDETAD